MRPILLAVLFASTLACGSQDPTPITVDGAAAELTVTAWIRQLEVVLDRP